MKKEVAAFHQYVKNQYPYHKHLYVERRVTKRNEHLSTVSIYIYKDIYFCISALFIIYSKINESKCEKLL